MSLMRQYYETAIGVEVHAELNTKTKIFCGCSTAFGSESNSNVCPVCSGQPGTLPVLNEAVVESAVKLGLVLGCSINQNSFFDRKNYFYPDLPKAYQISQFYTPICVKGSLEIELNGSKKNIGIREIHIEEDAGKLIHSNGDTFIDYNRAGVPLLEIVTMPDFRNADELICFLEKLRETMLYLEICDCKMEQGSLRVDLNLSINIPGDELGTRTETKNLNSFKAIRQALEYEKIRQIEIVSSGKKVIQETRRWNEEKNCSYPMRSKENDHDYRYFREPDLQRLTIGDEYLKKIHSSLPELAHDKYRRFIKDYGISEEIAVQICSSKNIAGIFEDIVNKSGEPKEAANLVTGELLRFINSSNLDQYTMKIDVDKLSYCIALLCQNKINRAIYKELINKIFYDNIDPQKFVNENNLLLVNDDNLVIDAVENVIRNNLKDAEDYISGKEKVFAYFMGLVMKDLGGKASPSTVKNVLSEYLNNYKSERSKAHV